MPDPTSQAIDPAGSTHMAGSKRTGARWLWLLRAVCCIAAAGCSPSTPTPGATAETVKKLVEAGKASEAVVGAKQILQLDPQAVEARLLLGRALLEIGSTKEAAVELRKVVDTRLMDGEALPLLAKALIDSQQYRSLIEDFGSAELTEPAAQARLDANLGLAHLSTGDKPRAWSLVDKAFAAAPRDPVVMTAKARVLWHQRAVDDALALAKAAVARGPRYLDAYILQGDIALRGKNDRQAAAAAYQEALRIRPDLPWAHMALAGIYATDNDLAKMEAQQVAMAKALPGHPLTIFVQSQVAAAKGDFTQAKELNDRIGKDLADTPVVLQYLGWVELRIGSLVQAERHLGKAVSQAPKARSPRRLLAITHLRNNLPLKAIEVLKPNVAGASPDAVSLQLMGEAYLQQGDTPAAEAQFKAAARVDPGNTRALSSLAVLRFASGDEDRAVSDLKALSTTSQDAIPELMLVSAHLKRKDFTQALTALKGLEAKLPASPLPDLLRARASLGLNNAAEARRSLDRALSKDGGYLAAIATHVEMDLADGKRDAAVKRLSDFLARQPQSIGAHLGLIDLQIKGGAPRADVIRSFESAMRSGPSDPRLRVALVRYLLAAGDLDSALSAARSAVSGMHDDVDVQQVLGDVLMLKKDYNQAVASYGKAASLRPDSEAPLLKLVDAQMAANDMAAAERSARRAVEISPRSQAARRAMFGVLLARKRYGDALALARETQRVNPKDPLGYQWEAEAHIGAGSHTAAIRAYKSGIESTLGGTLPERLFAVLESTQGRGEADKFAAEWQRKHPKDEGLPLFRGNSAVVRGDFNSAERHFAEATRANPASAVAQNNLAWVLARQGKPGSVELAIKATRLAPESLSYQDTLALALASETQYERAIQTARALLERAPTVPQYRLTLARVLAMGGQRSAALEQVEALERLGDSYKSQKEVAELRASLK